MAHRSIGNSIRLLRDARENYPAWLDAIARARQRIHFESYIIHDDDVGEQFADALIARARDAVRVRVIYDWMGGFGKTSRRFWRRLRAGGVEVRCYNPPHLASRRGSAATRSERDVAARGQRRTYRRRSAPRQQRSWRRHQRSPRARARGSADHDRRRDRSPRPGSRGHPFSASAGISARSDLSVDWGSAAMARPSFETPGTDDARRRYESVTT
jgi:hypothetical protein